MFECGHSFFVNQLTRYVPTKLFPPFLIGGQCKGGYCSADNIEILGRILPIDHKHCRKRGNMFEQDGKTTSTAMKIGVEIRDHESQVLDVQIENMRDPRPTVSVIIPTLNEAKNLPLVIPFLPMNWIDEVILVDGHSTDNTIEIAKQQLSSIIIVEEKSRGKGVALRAGYKAARGDILIVIDADGSHDPREIPRYVTALLEGADFVKGSRFAPGGGTTDMPRFRKLGNGAFVFLTNLLFGVNFTDLCYGYHAFWRYCLDAIGLEDCNGFEIDTALYLQAVQARLRIVDVPSFEGCRFYGMGKLRTIPDGMRVLSTIFRQWLRMISWISRNPPARFRGIRYARPEVFDRSNFPPENVSNKHWLLELMHLLNIRMSSEDKTQGVMEQILKITLNAVSADSSSLIIINENGDMGSGYLVSRNGFEKPEMSAWSNLLRNGLAGWVIRHHQTTVIHNTIYDPRWLRRKWDQTSRTAIALPLIVGGFVVGVLTLTRSVNRQFNAEEMSLLEELSLNISNGNLAGNMV